MTTNLEDIVEKEVQPQGTAFEGTKTMSSNPKLELDYLLYLKGTHQVIVDDTDTPACFAKLVLDENKSESGETKFLQKCVTDSREHPNCISSKLMMALLKRRIEQMKCSQNVDQYEFGREHGPALMFQLKHQNGHDDISLDLAFSLRIIKEDGTKVIYVPIPYYDLNYELQFYWRRTYLKEELAMIEQMTVAQREGYSMMKAVRDRHGDLDSLKSYYLKNTLIEMVKENSNCLSGTRVENLIEFMMVVLKSLNSKWQIFSCLD